MQAYTIECSVPIPPRKINLPPRGKGPRTPLSAAFLALRPGDSFLIPTDLSVPVKVQRGRISAFIAYARKNTDGKYCTRMLEDGVRVWRLS